MKNEISLRIFTPKSKVGRSRIDDRIIISYHLLKNRIFKTLASIKSHNRVVIDNSIIEARKEN